MNYTNKVDFNTSENTFRNCKIFTANLCDQLMYRMNNHFKLVISVKDRLTEHYDSLTSWIIVCLNAFMISAKYIYTCTK